MLNNNFAKYFIISLALILVIIFLLMPLSVIFYEAFKGGIDLYLSSITNPDAISAIKLTLIVVLISVPLNMIFGVFAAWCIAKFDFPGKTILSTLIDLPFSVSPVISGFIYLALFSTNFFVELGNKYDLQIMFAVPGIVLVTIFVTFPFVARELIPLMKEQGNDEEEAALMLGANGFKTFWYITLPHIKWGLIYGVLLCNARAMGEFGAVSVVSGHIRGETNTIPLYVEVLYNEYNFVAAFAVSSILTAIALVTILVKILLDSRSEN